MKRGKSIIDKIWDEHVVYGEPNFPDILAVDLQLLHEVTSPPAFAELDRRGLPFFEPHRAIATLDHSLPTSPRRHLTSDPLAGAQIVLLRRNSARHGVPLFDLNSGKQGIVHVIGPELGLTQPGMVIVCGDSHTSTHGAFGALAFGIGGTEIGHVMATGCLLISRPKTLKVEFQGDLPAGVFAKDLIMALIAAIGAGGANGHVIEYRGAILKNLSMEARMTICNMSIECGARAGLIAPDDKTFAYLQGRQYSPALEDRARALAYWQSLSSDTDAIYDREITLKLDQLEPMVSWGTNPGQSIGISQPLPDPDDLTSDQGEAAAAAMAHTGLLPGQPLAGVAIDWAFLGSCTNGRIEDLRIAAAIMRGKQLASGVKMYVVPGSEMVKKQAEAEGLDQVFLSAGASWRNPGCSMCLAMNGDKVPAGRRAISSTNRNFRGRQGPQSITHIASPATVAASALAGKISSPREYFFDSQL